MIDLKSVVEKYPECLNSAEKLRAYLTDLYPSEKAKVSVVVSIFSCGIAEEIERSKKIDDITIERFRTRLENVYGYSQKISGECLALWLEVYGKSILIKDISQNNITLPHIHNNSTSIVSSARTQKGVSFFKSPRFKKAVCFVIPLLIITILIITIIPKSLATITKGLIHNHDYSAATCTEPEKCSCGATKGSALGHKWENATCKKPKTCSVCNASEGLSLGHIYENYICVNCAAEDTEGKKTNPLYALSLDTKYYHFGSITNMQDDRELKVVTLYFSKETKICRWTYTDYSSQFDVAWDDSNNENITYNDKTYYYRGGIGTDYGYELTDSSIILLEDGKKIAKFSCEKDGSIKLIQGEGVGVDIKDKLSLAIPSTSSKK